MEIQVFDSPLFYRITNAVTRTLLHSIWQGMLLVILAGIVLIFTSKLRSNLRYNLLASLLFIFALVNGITFWTELKKYNSPTMSTLIDITNISETTGKSYFTSLNYDSNAAFQPINYFSNVLNHNVVLIFTIWLVIFIFKSIKITVGIISIHRIKNHNASPVEDLWLHRLEQLAEKLGINRKISLFESGRISSPMVLGFFKPMIIVPLGFFTNLPHNQIDAILLHELAHIKREDYLVNLLQSLLENIFFFNPAVFWLSKLIREEREFCCDDVAINALENKAVFVNALVAFQEYRLANPELIITFAGTKNHLLYRIKRIILNNNNKPLNAMEKLFVTTCIIITVVLSAAFSNINQSKIVENKVKLILNAPTFENKVIPLIQNSNASFTNRIKIQNNDTIIKDTLPKLQDLNAEVIEAKRQYEQIRNDNAEERKNRIDYWKAIWESRKQTVELKLRSDAFQKQKSNVNVVSEKITANTQNQTDNSKLLAKEKQYQLNLALNKMQQEVLKMDSANIKEQLETARLIENDYYKNYESRENKLKQARQNYQQKLQEELINDLMRAGIINNKENLSFKLHNKFFIVNGVTQPEAIQEKFKAKFLDASWKEWLYNFEGKTGYFVTGIRFQG